MPNKNLTLGLALVFAGTALAQARGHHSHHTSTSGGNYVIRNGDFDWAIAHKHGLTVHQLHAANPSVNWDGLRVGLHITIPGEGAVSHTVSHRFVEHSSSHSSTSSYTIRDGDNDWLVAHRAGISIHALKALNPSINWNRIHPGQHIAVPGSAHLASSHVIHGRYAKIAADAVRIHREAGMNAEVITTVDAGLHVKVLDHDGQWYLLKFPKGTKGWVKGEFLKASEAPEEVASTRRHSSSSRYASRHRRRRHHGNSGEYLASADVPKGNALIHKALSFRGTPYVWGGTSRSGMDCSALVQRAYATQGISLPRTSREQAHVGTRVSKGQLQPGDILLFHTGRGNRITHAAVYIGKGKFVHASSGGGKVQVNSMNDGYYAHHFSMARRVLKKSHSKSSPGK